MTTEAAHAPGPWKAAQQAGSHWAIFWGGNDVIASTREANFTSATVEANARLIAASPNLLEALHEIVEALSTRGDETPDALYQYIAEAAQIALDNIAKTEGGE